MIVTVCLSKGALAMSRKQVIVKRINAIQNLGAMDVLGTDKTGTLTMDRVILERHCDVALKEDDGVLTLAYMHSHFQTGLKNLDRAVLAHTETHTHANIPEYAKVDESPFDFQRRIMTVAVRTPEDKDRIISKGTPEAISPRSCRWLRFRFWPTICSMTSARQRSSRLRASWETASRYLRRLWAAAWDSRCFLLLYGLLLVLTLFSYVVLTQLVKTWLLRMKWI